MTEMQQTLKTNLKLKGVGLHTGELVNIEICPAPANHGYISKNRPIQSNTYHCRC